MAALADSTVGMLVSRISPQYEIEPTAAIRRREALFAVNERLGTTLIRWAPDFYPCPTLGAGLWIRKALLEQILTDFGSEHLPGRVLGHLACGEDIELGIATARLGYQRVYVPDLEIRHQIPASRFEPNYVVRLIKGILRSQISLDHKYMGWKESWFKTGCPSSSRGRTWLGCRFEKRGYFARISLYRCSSLLPAFKVL